MNHEIMHSAKRVKALVNAAITADADGIWIDLRGAMGCLIVVNLGVTAGPADATNFWELKLKEAADDGAGAPDAGTIAAVAEADMVGALSGTITGVFAKIDDAAEDDAIFSVGYIGRKPWVRLTCDATLSPGSTPIGAIAIIYPLRRSADAA